MVGPSLAVSVPVGDGDVLPGLLHRRDRNRGRILPVAIAVGKIGHIGKELPEVA